MRGISIISIGIEVAATVALAPAAAGAVASAAAEHSLGLTSQAQQLSVAATGQAAGSIAGLHARG